MERIDVMVGPVLERNVRLISTKLPLGTLPPYFMASRQYPHKAGLASIVVATYARCYGGSVNDLHASIATINGDSACGGR